jgi:hypothetical protein
VAAAKAKVEGVTRRLALSKRRIALRESSVLLVALQQSYLGST